jgi:hypothetical protein
MLFDIFFISYQEPNADSNWDHLRSCFPYARRLHGVDGIHKAHSLAAKLASSKYFWVVDGDSTIVTDFDFTPPHKLMDQYQKDKIDNVVYVYRALNPVNDLSYGYGGLKLLPRLATATMDTQSVDMTTSISKHFYPVDQIASTTKFNTDPFSTWKSAFRESVKLSSCIIDGQVDTDTQQRLDTWCTYHNGAAYGDWAIVGANAGRRYGTDNKNNTEALRLINNFDWLKKQYEYQMAN